MMLLKSILGFFSVRSGERRLVSLLLLHSFFVGITLTLTDTAAYTLFLTRYENAGSILPLAYIVASLVTIGVGVVYSWLESHLSFVRLLSVNLGFVIVLLLVLRFLFSSVTDQWPALLAVASFDVIWVMTSLEFWGLAGRVFNVRQGKRLFGLVGTGEMMASVIGGAAVPFLVRIIDTTDFLLLSAISIVISFLLMQYIVRRYLGANIVREAAPGADSIKQAHRELLKQRYIVFILALAGISVATLYFVDNAFYNQAEQHFSNAEDLAAFLGVFLSSTGFVQLIIRAYGSGWFLRRFGVRSGLLILPVALIVGAVLVIGSQLFGAIALIFGLVVVTKFFDKSFRFSLNRPSALVLYQPLKVGDRLWVQTISESIVEPTAGFITGVILLFLNLGLGFGSVELLVGLLFIALVWVFVVVTVGREYQGMLVKALNRRWLNGSSLSFTDSASIEVLSQKLKSTHPGDVIHALTMLESVRHPHYETYVLELLSHPAPEVRLHAIHAVERHRIVPAQSAMIDALIHESVPHISGTVLQVLATLGADAVVAPYLEHPEKEIKRGAIVGLLKQGGDESVREARGCLMELAESKNPLERKLAAEIIGSVAYSEFRGPLLRLLRDENTAVRLASIIAAGYIRQDAFIPILVESLLENAFASVSTSALVAHNQVVLPHLFEVFGRERLARPMRVRVLRAIGAVGGEKAVEWLVDHMTYSDEYVRYHILRALMLCHYSAGEAQQKNILEQIKREVESATWKLAAVCDLTLDPQSLILYDALQQDIELNRRRILLLLSFIYDKSSISGVRDHYNHPSKEKRAYAVEILDTLLESELKTLLLPLFRNLPDDVQLGRLQSSYPQDRFTQTARIQQICSGDVLPLHPWTTAAALYCAVRMDALQMSKSVLRRLNDPDIIVHETAIWAIARTAPGLYKLYVEQYLSRLGVYDAVRRGVQQIEREKHGESRMLLTVEKVIILKTVSIFSETPENLLAEVAQILEEVSVAPGQQFITRGDIGDCMYIIASGQVRVHDNEDRTIALLAEREVVGELALLDSEPRLASVSAMENAVLLKLNQEPFYELIANHPEVMRGIMRVLTRRLRTSTAG